MNNELVTVFGGSGFVGRYVVRALAKAGYRIRVAVRHPNRANYLVPMGHVGQIQLVGCNVRDEAAVAAALRGTHIVVNLVGILAEGGGQSFDGVQAQAPRILGRAAKAAGADRFVHLSALGADAQSDSGYAKSKGDGEVALLDAFASATILRPSLIVGPEDDFFNRFAQMARLSPVLPVIGGGRTKFQPVFVGDIARAVLICIEQWDTQGKIYELGGPTVYSFRALMELMLRVTERDRAILSIPFWLASPLSFVLQFVPGAPLTPDQVLQLRRDNVLSGTQPGFEALGIQPDAIEAILPEYLWRFRKEGQYQQQVDDEILTGLEAAPKS